MAREGGWEREEESTRMCKCTKADVLAKRQVGGRGMQTGRERGDAYGNVAHVDVALRGSSLER